MQCSPIRPISILTKTRGDPGFVGGVKKVAFCDFEIGKKISFILFILFHSFYLSTFNFLDSFFISIFEVLSSSKNKGRFSFPRLVEENQCVLLKTRFVMTNWSRGSVFLLCCF